MAIVQISRITNRKGLSEDLPEPLAGAELGWCLDTRRLFIGNGDLAEGAPAVGNTEILTEYSDIFSFLGSYIYQGQAGGYVREDLPVGFAIEFFLHAMQGLLQGPLLEQLRLAPSQAIAQGIDLFFGGLLTNAGRKQYEKLFPR